ncbi:BEL1-like homeodomain protein 9 [Arachis duranensis]|uniref:BEL1-like homeodomain protein 9 n=1 Tax=Arachis duranensis TaxID=130453 RepID=A0A6P4AZF8_ARADU|nr:BEL1-like homeodomain protein 9 [Arachis duranensis]
MEENFESSHVPQQSRRNKLREMVQTQKQQPPPQPFPPSFQTSITQPFETNPISSTFISTKPPYHYSFLAKSSSQLEHYPASFHNLLLPPYLVDQNHHVPQEPCSDVRNIGPVVVPFTGYASILKRSRFLKPAQQILEDMCGSVLNPPPRLNESGDDHEEDPIIGTNGRDGVQHHCRDSVLGCMLDEVYKKYILYCQQMQSVVSSFQKVAGLGNATPYISFGIKSISKHFGCLKHAIYDQLQFTMKNTTPASNNVVEKGLQSVQRLHSVQPVLRSQRGLPDHAVALLRRWLFEHFLHPYPTDSEKDTLVQQTGLSRCQVSNWFINARVRIWKPMVEEMHMNGEQKAQESEVIHHARKPIIGP